MKIAVFSDAHGNGLYFNKCMAAIKNHAPDRMVFLGDCFGYMRDGNSILTTLKELDAKILMGNHEAMMLGRIQYDAGKEEIYGLKTDRKSISSNNLRYIEGLHSEYYEEIDKKKILYVHGRPDNPLNGYLYEDDKTYNWKQNRYDFVFMGHTHYPYMKKIGAATYINVGSCGLPRDNGKAPSYVIFDTQTWEAIIYRILISESELENMMIKKIHPKVYECLMREGKNVCQKLM